MSKSWYVGKSRTSGDREVFRSDAEPTEETHGGIYAYVVGPHRTRRGADLMARTGSFNPHLRTAADADRIAGDLVRARAVSSCR